MKKIKMFLTIFCLFLAPHIVNAANASANNWKLFCDSVEITASQTTNCYLIAQITDATDGGKPINAVLTTATTSKAEVVNAMAAFNYIQVDKTLASAKFGNTFHGENAYCNSSGNCYDFISSQGIVSNPNDSKVTSRGFTGYTPIGYWNIKLNADQITNDTDCGKICVFVDYVVDGQSVLGNSSSQNGNANAPCIEINLKQEQNAVCYCNSSSNICYGANGAEVSREQYEAECKNSCKYENGIYYGPSGSQVTEAEYKAKCTCRVSGGKYYDDTGAEVTQEVYNTKCAKACYQSNGKYYGKTGAEITKEQYERDCVPKTGSFASYAVLIAGALIALSAITIAKKHNKFYRV